MDLLHMSILKLPSPAQDANVPPGQQPAASFIPVPQKLVSPQALRHVGYTAATANMLWNRWCIYGGRGGTNFAAFLGYMMLHCLLGGTPPPVDRDGDGNHSHSDEYDDYCDDDDDDDDVRWHDRLHQLGVTTEVIQQVLWSRRTAHEVSTSCIQLAGHQVYLRYADLIELHRASIMRDKRLAALARGTGGGQY